MVFIDGSNFYHNLKKTYGRTDLDFYCFSKKLCGPRQLVRTYYYNCPVDPRHNPEKYKQQQHFFATLYQTPYLEIALGRLQRKDDGRVTEKGVDVKIAVNMLHKAYLNQYDVAVLITGDADFVQVVQAVKDLAKHVELAYFKDQPCYHLKTAVDRSILLSPEYLNDCWANK